jgi:hypothetical protein
VIVERDYRKGYVISFTEAPMFPYRVTFEDDQLPWPGSRVVELTSTLLGARWAIRRDIRQRKKMVRLNRKFGEQS